MSGVLAELPAASQDALVESIAERVLEQLRPPGRGARRRHLVAARDRLDAQSRWAAAVIQAELLLSTRGGGA